MQSESSTAIDLSLAVNYLPACSCMGKSFLLSLCLCATRSLALAPAYVGVGLLLVFDRLLQGRACILDGSSVLAGIFLAHSVSEIQESAAAPSPPWGAPYFWALSAEWAALAGYRLFLCCQGQHPHGWLGAQHPQSKPHQPSARRWSQQAEFLLACAHVSALAFYREPSPEQRCGVRVARHLSFALLCVCWMYVVGIHLRRVSNVAADSAVHFASYFWPVLYVHPYVATGYACAVLVAVALHLRPAQSAVYALPQSASAGYSPRPSAGYSPRQPAYSAQPQAYAHPPPLRLELLPDSRDEPALAASRSPARAQSEEGDQESLAELERVFREALMNAKPPHQNHPHQ